MKFSININRRFFLIALTSFAASTVFSSCSSPQNNSVANTATNTSIASITNTSITGAKDKIKVGVTPVPAGEQASQPIFATLARNFDVDVNILSGVWKQ